MSTPPAPSVLLVDFGGVLTTSTVAATRAWCAESGITYRQFVGPLIEAGPDGSLLDRLETGRLDVASFETQLGAAITAGSGVSVDATAFVRDVVGAAAPDPAMFALVDELRAAGLRTGLLSNSWGNDYPRDLLDPHFDDVVISGEVGLRKPDARIYELAASRFGVAPSACVFVDDLKANLAAAEELGIRGVLHVDAATTRAALADLLPQAIS